MLSATENAPKNVEELKELLQHDTKVKVASTSFFRVNTNLLRDIRAALYRAV
jgi:hypothetical protein